MMNISANTITAPDVAKFNKLREAANEVVNKMFFGEMLKSFRQSQDNPYFGNGSGNKVFVEKLDSEMITAMSKNNRNGMADSLLKQLDPSGYNAFRLGQIQTNGIQESGVTHE